MDFISYINNLPKEVLPSCGQCGGGINVTTMHSPVRDEIELSVHCQSCGTCSVGGISGKVLVALDEHEIIRVFMDTLADVAHHLSGGIIPPRIRLPLPEELTLDPKKKEDKKPIMRKGAPWDI